MLHISFVSSGTTVSQTPILSTISYELVKQGITKNNLEKINFPLACVFDFSNMYSTLEYFASDKILMRMKEIISLIEVIRSTEGNSKIDWSRCSFPSKYVHKGTKIPLFFAIPVLPRGMTEEISRQEITSLVNTISKISKGIAKQNSQYLIFDVPGLDIVNLNLISIAPLLLSNVIFQIIDCDKSTYEAVAKEVRTITKVFSRLDSISTPKLEISGLILNKATEKVLGERWKEKLQEDFSIPVIGVIKEDPQLNTLAGQYQIPLTDENIKKIKSPIDFQNIVNSIDEELIKKNRIINEQQLVKKLEEGIYQLK